MPALSPDVRKTLAGVAREMTRAEDRWWLIGGAACALHGLAVEIADIDVIMSVRDAKQILSDLGIAPEPPGGAGRFRSATFGRWKGLPLQVDLMGGFEVHAAGESIAVLPITREAIEIGGQPLYVPSRRELASILCLFGRPKDIARARALAASF